MVFVPIRFVYPSRTSVLPVLTNGFGAAWAAAVLAVLWRYPEASRALVLASLAYPVYYVALSLFLQFRRSPAPRHEPSRDRMRGRAARWRCWRSGTGRPTGGGSSPPAASWPEAVSIPAGEPDLAGSREPPRCRDCLRRASGWSVQRVAWPSTGASRRWVWPRGCGRHAASRYRSRISDPSFADDGRTATSRTTVTLREPGAEGGADSVDAREVEMTWTRGDAWQLSLVTILEGEDP